MNPVLEDKRTTLVLKNDVESILFSLFTSLENINTSKIVHKDKVILILGLITSLYSFIHEFTTCERIHQIPFLLTKSLLVGGSNSHIFLADVKFTKGNMSNNRVK